LEEVSININNILGSIASTTRLKMLRLLSRKEMGYSELMDSLGMEKDRDAGKFSYHLKKLLDSRLIEVHKETGKYKISRIGLTVLENLDKLEKALGTKEMLIVRRSENIIEPFDKTKIINSLMKEANITPKLAIEIASIVEEKLHNLKIEYLTAPLIRELVNTVLLDMGLEKYRHKLSRIGMPIYDVSKHLKKTSERGDPREFIEESSKSIMREYCLQDFLSRNTAEMHLTGRLDFYPLDHWLTGIVARSYRAPSNDEEILETMTDIASSIINIKHEINLKVDDGRGLENAFRMLRHAISKSLLKGRYISITLSIRDLLENHAKIMELSKMVGQPTRRVKTVIVVDEPVYAELLKLDELLRNLKLQYVITNSEESLYCGLRLPMEKSFSDIHAIFSLNTLLSTLESNKEVDSILNRIRELTTYGLSALSKRTKTFEEIYGKRYSTKIHYACSLWGLFEATKTIYGVGPQISKESYSFFNDVIQSFIESLKKYSSGRSRLLKSSRIPKSSAQRMLRATYHKLSIDELNKMRDYGFLLIPPTEKFRNIEERALLESRIAPYFDGGYLTIIKGYKRKKIIEDATILFESLVKTENPFTIKIEEALTG
jgi:DNA-binding transcriptional ArsR family regulator